ncbi:MAG: hypothetical protein JO301_12090 [Chitinophagaceae bacterium]|nr:hypothetical protein [Chitinophagaceae bacterium]
MKTLVAYLVLAATIFLLIGFAPFGPQTKRPAADALNGAWGYTDPSGTTVLIFADNVFSVASYDVPGKKFNRSYGGVWHLEGDKLMRKIEWDSADSTRVGTELTETARIADGKLQLQPAEKWERLDNGGPGELAGAWIITGNYNNDKVSKRASPFFPRRTMKVLSGKYFHWIAYNLATRQFLNAGGGEYTTANGKYTESIGFFTKTAGSIGKSLVFDYSFVNGDWRHKGEKSTGGPLDECWTRRAELEKQPVK